MLCRAMLATALPLCELAAIPGPGSATRRLPQRTLNAQGEGNKRGQTGPPTSAQRARAPALNAWGRTAARSPARPAPAGGCGSKREAQSPKHAPPHRGAQSWRRGHPPRCGAPETRRPHRPRIATGCVSLHPRRPAGRGVAQYTSIRRPIRRHGAPTQTTPPCDSRKAPRPGCARPRRSRDAAHRHNKTPGVQRARAGPDGRQPWTRLAPQALGSRWLRLSVDAQAAYAVGKCRQITGRDR